MAVLPEEALTDDNLSVITFGKFFEFLENLANSRKFF